LVWFALALLQGLITVSVFALVFYLCYNWYYDQPYLKCKNFLVLFLKDDDFKSQVQMTIEEIVRLTIGNIVRSCVPSIRVVLGAVAAVVALWRLRYLSGINCQVIPNTPEEICAFRVRLGYP
jgi:hypothetical protein